MSQDVMKNFTLRVKRGSELDKMLRALEDEPKTEAELKEIGGKSRSPWLARSLSHWFDNIAIDVPYGETEGEHSLTYTDVMPNQVQVVSDKVEMSGNGRSAGKEFSITWPEAPPVPETLENFDEPSWFETFRTMVKKGKHYSFEGPPSVGKDTAVIELAAQERKPLVTIGGDGGFRKRDLTGGFADIGVFIAGEYVAAAIFGWWVLLTEVNAADPDALMYINSQMAPPHVVTLNGRAYPVHEDFRIFVSYNHGLVGTKPLPQSFKDRFTPLKVPFFKTEYQLRKRLEAMGMPDDVEEVTFTKPATDNWGKEIQANYIREAWTDTIVKFGMEMWDAHERGQMRYQITTRRLIDSSDLMVNIEDISIEDALEMAVLNAIDSPVERQAAKQVLESVLSERERRVD